VLSWGKILTVSQMIGPPAFVALCCATSLVTARLQGTATGKGPWGVQEQFVCDYDADCE
jgi:hypothetical protein